MKPSIKILAAAALLSAAAGASGASAAPTATLVNWSTNGVGNQAHIFGAGFSGSAGGNWSSDPFVDAPPQNVGGIYQSPFNNTPPFPNNTDYYSVGGENGANGALSPVTLTFNKAIDYFNILWGSLDSYNKLSFYDGAGLIVSYTGTQINALIKASCLLPGACTGTGQSNPNGNNSTNFEQVARVHFSGLGAATYAIFSSQNTNGTQRAAMEFALIPVPAALPLFGTALGGLLLLRSRRKRQSSSALTA